MRWLKTNESGDFWERTAFSGRAAFGHAIPAVPHLLERRCPYNSFRTSGDIINVWDRVIENLLSALALAAVAACAPPWLRTRARTCDSF